MKRFSIVILTALMALFVSACGEQAEKKVEAVAGSEMEAPKAAEEATAQPEQMPQEETKAATEAEGQ